MKPFRLTLLQTSPALGDPRANQRDLSARVKRAKKDSDLVLAPELALHGYLLEELARDTALKRGAAALKNLAKDTGRCRLAAGGVFEDSDHQAYNAGFYFEKGRLEVIQKKLYPPSYGMFDEGRYFGAGDSLEVFKAGPFKAVMLLCEDAWHPALALQAVQRGANLLLVLASSPTRGWETGLEGPRIQRTWTRILGAMAESLGVYVAFCNRVGMEDGLGFWGGSMVIGPEGDTLAQAPLGKSAVVRAGLDRGAVARARRKSPLVAMERADYNARAFAQIAGWQLAPPVKKVKK